jgi:uncharacterized protein
MRFLILYFILFSLELFGMSKPSWCNIAKKSVEKRICSSSKFWEKDKELVKAYNKALDSASRAEKRELKRSQKRWWQDRNRKCEVESDECILDMYSNRISFIKDRYLSNNSNSSSNKPVWCSIARKIVERRICKNPKFWEKDKELVRVYNKALNSASRAEKRELKRSQKRWWQDRNKKCEIESDECILQMYQQRINMLKSRDFYDSNNQEVVHIQKNLKKGDHVRVLKGSVFIEMGSPDVSKLLEQWDAKNYVKEEWKSIAKDKTKLEKEIEATVVWCGKFDFAKQLKENVCDIRPIPGSLISIRDPKTDEVKEINIPDDTESMLYLITTYGVRERDVEVIH